MISTLKTSPLEQWYTVQCKTGKERITSKILGDVFEMKIYLPEIHLSSGKGRNESVPFFPGYFFVWVDLEKVELHCINTSPGVLKVLNLGNGPQAVPPSLISAIQEMVNGINTGHRAPGQKLLAGDMVRIKTSSFQGLEAVVVRMQPPHERVRILLHILGQASKTQVSKERLEQIKNTPTTRTERRTRGRGRRIRQATLPKSHSY